MVTSKCQIVTGSQPNSLPVQDACGTRAVQAIITHTRAHPFLACASADARLADRPECNNVALARLPAPGRRRLALPSRLSFLTQI